MMAWLLPEVLHQRKRDWGDVWSVLLKRITPKAEYQPLKVHIVFDDYTDDQVYSVTASKRTEVMVGGCILGMICKICK